MALAYCRVARNFFTRPRASHALPPEGGTPNLSRSSRKTCTSGEAKRKCRRLVRPATTCAAEKSFHPPHDRLYYGIVNPGTEHRKLTKIMLTDMVDYSALVCLYKIKCLR